MGSFPGSSDSVCLGGDRVYRGVAYFVALPRYEGINTRIELC